MRGNPSSPANSMLHSDLFKWNNSSISLILNDDVIESSTNPFTWQTALPFLMTSVFKHYYCKWSYVFYPKSFASEMFCFLWCFSSKSRRELHYIQILISNSFGSQRAIFFRYPVFFKRIIAFAGIPSSLANPTLLSNWSTRRKIDKRTNDFLITKETTF